MSSFPFGFWRLEPTSGGAGDIPTANLHAHYKTDAGINKDASDRIYQWDDQSGNGNHLVQSTGTNQPLHNSANQLNGFDAISLAGTQTTAEFLSSTSTLLYNSTIFIVFKVEYDGSPHDYYDVISADNGAGSYLGTKWLSVWSLIGPGVKYEIRDRSQTSSEYRKQSSNYLFGKNTPVYTTINITPPLGTTIRVRGADDSVGTETGTNFVTSVTGWNLGKMSNNNVGFDGDIWEVIIYDGTLSAGDITTVESYLATKYAL